MNETTLAWPNGKKVAVTVTVMYETWSEGTAPNYSVQTTHLKPGTVDHAGKAWSTYGGRVGVWRIIRALDRLGIPATFFVNARCAELYPESVKQIVRSGHDVGGHAYTQDGLLGYMTPEQQQQTVAKSRDILASATGRKPDGWLSPVLAFTPETVDVLAQEGFRWHADVTYIDLPHRIKTKHGIMAAVPNSDFTDNRVLRSSPKDLYDVHTGTFDYMVQNEPLAQLGLTLHCHFGGRPMITAVFEQIIRYFQKSPDVWFARHSELAQWALDAKQDEHTYAERFFSRAS
jgi:peptidoglycan/xylan/chitin deacetylase (PgdA/CDA1 family)